MIVRDEASTLEECLKSAKPHVDELCILDTGSVDDTPAIARKYADKFETRLDCLDNENRMADFSLARNQSWDMAAGDWVFWIDGDDILEGGENLLRACDNAPPVDNLVYMAPYEYEYDADGNVTTLHHRERLLRPRHRFLWQCPVHEGCMPIQPVEGSLATLPLEGVVVKHQIHKSQKPRDPMRNLRILEGYVQKNEEGDPRAMFYLGLECYLIGRQAPEHQWRIGQALTLLQRYVEIAGWTDERCLALLELARIYAHLGDHRQAEHWALQALVTKSWPAPYFQLGRTFYALGVSGRASQREYNFRRASSMFEQGLLLVQHSANTTLMQNPREQYEIHEFLNCCLSSFGEFEKAIASCEAGLRGLPNNESLQNNLQVYRTELARQSVHRGIDALKEAGKLSAEAARAARAALEGQVLEAGGETVRELPPREERPAPGDKLDIVLFVGRGLEPWTPETLRETGLGGSESMAWYVARGLARKGHRVRLYGHCTPTQESVYEGVEWYDEGRFRGVDCDALIVSRRPDGVDDHWDCRAHARFLWVHDIHCGEALDLTRTLRLDEIWCLSRWHLDNMRAAYPTMEHSKLVQIRNALDMELWDRTTAMNVPVMEPQRDPHKAVYSSSPDRGLQTALDCWPRVREQVPDATLHVYYGFENWEKVCEAHNDQPALKTIRYLKHLMETTEGVVYHGRVSETELAQAYFSAGVWAYPTWWLETSCISAMQAQAAGLYMVTSPVAALNETAGERAYMCRYDQEDQAYWRSTEYMEEWTGSVIGALDQSDDIGVGKACQSRADLQQYAREHFGMDELVDEMLERIRRRIAANAEAVTPEFVEFKE
jgi:tetratricopeptide (TPR) repeat protein